MYRPPTDNDWDAFVKGEKARREAATSSSPEVEPQRLHQLRKMVEDLEVNVGNLCTALTPFLLPPKEDVPPKGPAVSPNIVTSSGVSPLREAIMGIEGRIIRLNEVIVEMTHSLDCF